MAHSQKKFPQQQQKLPSPFSKPAEGEKLVAGNTQFTVDLYRQLLAERSNDNVFFSPASISIALAMTYLGARENTAAEMKQVTRPVKARA